MSASAANHSDPRPAAFDSAAALPLSVAPMMAWTTPAQRYFMRLITRRTSLYTEMVTTGALIHGPRDDLLAHDVSEHPVALQLGGSEPADMARCAVMAEDAGYDEVNINVGCPSDRVRNGAFGACLMAEPQRVADCVSAMQARVAIPVTVKTRIGIDDQDAEADLHHFVRTVASAGCAHFTIHARKAWLQGLSPKENREKPPLNYPRVHRLKTEFPALYIGLNGGVEDLEQARAQLDHVDAVMIGRAAYQRPYMMAMADQTMFGETAPAPDRENIVEAYLPYVSRQLARGERLAHLTRHLLGLYHGCPGGRKWRRVLSEGSCRTGAGIEIIQHALELVQRESELAEVA
jgi:tRNA-dihydrouridine synthase A